jgi:hypothetical protein
MSHDKTPLGYDSNAAYMQDKVNRMRHPDEYLDSILAKPSNPKDIVAVSKAPMSCVPAGVLAEVAVAMYEGACKYGRHNYRVGGVQASIYYDATMRHLMAWWEGQDFDPDTATPQHLGLSHVTKAIASLVVLRDAMLQSQLNDDRPPSLGSIDYSELNHHCKELLDRTAKNVSPVHYTKLGQDVAISQTGPSNEPRNR